MEETFGKCMHAITVLFSFNIFWKLINFFVSFYLSAPTKSVTQFSHEFLHMR